MRKRRKQVGVAQDLMGLIMERQNERGISFVRSRGFLEDVDPLVDQPLRLEHNPCTQINTLLGQFSILDDAHIHALAPLFQISVKALDFANRT